MKKYFLILLVCLMFPAHVHAEPVELAISPPVVEILIAPNKKVSQTFNVTSRGEGISIVPEIHVVSPSDANGHVTVDPSPFVPSSVPFTISSPNYPFGQPIKVSGSTLPITLTFEAASVDIAQDIYLALVVRGVGDNVLKSASSTTPAISSLILVTINPSGVTPINIEIKDFAPSFFHDSWLPLTISPILENKVPIMIRPEGKYEVISPAGKVIYSLPLYPNLILGNSGRAIKGRSGDIESPESLREGQLSWSPKWSNIGPHRLHLTITTQGGTKLTDIEKIIWVLPIRIMIILTLFFILLIIYVANKYRSPKLPIDSPLQV